MFFFRSTYLPFNFLHFMPFLHISSSLTLSFFHMSHTQWHSGCLFEKAYSKSRMVCVVNKRGKTHNSNGTLTIKNSTKTAACSEEKSHAEANRVECFMSDTSLDDAIKIFKLLFDRFLYKSHESLFAIVGILKFHWFHSSLLLRSKYELPWYLAFSGMHLRSENNFFSIFRSFSKQFKLRP